MALCPYKVRLVELTEKVAVFESADHQRFCTQDPEIVGEFRQKLEESPIEIGSVFIIYEKDGAIIGGSLVQ